ncbi:site-specific integrase [Guyparkeria sp. 1SP6A2]|nr:site-specific integrase [Guyparkeria sp. 1SP6A2]
MAKPQKLLSGRYRVQPMTANGRISRTFRTKAEAQRYLNKIAYEQDMGTWQDPQQAKETPFALLADEYLEKQIATQKSGRQNVYVVNRLKEWFGHLSLAQLTARTIADWKHYRRQQVADSTVLKEMQFMSSIFNLAEREWGHLLPNGNPVRGVSKPRPSTPRDRRPTPDELDRLLKAAESDAIRAIIRLAVATAMRRTELALCQWAMVDIETRIVVLPEWLTKNGKTKRVPLSRETARLLRNLHEEQGRPVDGRVFRLTPDFITKAFGRARRLARETYEQECGAVGENPKPGYLMDLRMHDLRHEAISRLIERGLTIPEVQVVSGHRTVSQLMRYTHLTAEHVLQKLD